VLLGWELVSVDPGAGTIEVVFTASEQFLNPVGVIQGGFLAAMLDDTLGPALVATLGPGQFAPTTDLHVQFMRPARPGRLTGRGRIVHRGTAVAFLAGELLDDSGQVVAAATATAQIRGGRSLLKRERTGWHGCGGADWGTGSACLGAIRAPDTPSGKGIAITAPETAAAQRSH